MRGNDGGHPATLVRHTAPAHGTLDLNQDGSFRYSPPPGFTGVDTFTYSISDAVSLYTTDVAPVATIGGGESHRRCVRFVALPGAGIEGPHGGPDDHR
jgi:hypothetical protein